MATRKTLPDGLQNSDVGPAADRPPKRLKTDETASLNGVDAEQHTLVRKHPLGVRPSGNALNSTINLKSLCGSFARLPDELLAHFLETLPALSLLRLGSTCRALHAFTRNDELWKALFVESSQASFTWRGTWRSTYLMQAVSQEPKIDCFYLFSDALHRPYYCAHVSLERYARAIPEHNQIARLSDISAQDFSSRWHQKPFILTSPVRRWPIFRYWSIDYLAQKYPDVGFRAESVDWPLKTYLDYMNDNRDESPLYLFDRSFAEKTGLVDSGTAADYSPPPCFGSDAFAVLGDQRPDHRWLIIGPARSGSTFHKDPNATSAWNAVVRGSKYWIMFPSSPSLPPPPGVYVSEDQSEVTSPLSIAEWLLEYHAEARASPGCQEGICYQGEVLHVPSGWYHLVLNLEPSIAITQNFVPRARVGTVLQFLRDQKQSISGFSEEISDPYTLFVERLGRADPELLEEGLIELDSLSRRRKGKWEALTRGEQSGEEVRNSNGFSFGFGDGDSDGSVA